MACHKITIGLATVNRCLRSICCVRFNLLSLLLRKVSLPHILSFHHCTIVPFVPHPLTTIQHCFWFSGFWVFSLFRLFAGTKVEIRNHYRGHKLSMWLSLIPQLHAPGDLNELSMRHHHFLEENPQYYDGMCLKPHRFLYYTLHIYIYTDNDYQMQIYTHRNTLVAQANTHIHTHLFDFCLLKSNENVFNLNKTF